MLIAGLAITGAAPSWAQANPHGALVPVSPIDNSTAAFRLIASQEAKKADVPYDLVDAVMKIESGYQPGQIGGVGEIGLMQVRPATAAMMGFRGGSAGLAEPAVNIHYGTTYLGQAWHLAHGDVCRTLMKYRAGHGEEVMSALSSTYCARAKAHLVAIGSPLATSIKASDLVAATRPSEGATETGGRIAARGGPAFWTAFKARIRAANARIEAKWRRVAAR